MIRKDFNDQIFRTENEKNERNSALEQNRFVQYSIKEVKNVEDQLENVAS